MSDLTTATPLSSKDAKHKDKQLRKEQKRLRKEQKKEMKHQDKLLKKGHHGGMEAPLATGTGLGAASALPVAPGAPVVQSAAVPVAPVVAAPVGGMQNLSLGDKVVHEAERVIQHQPLVEKQVINERPVEVKHEHHIQPVVHETEHRIQPIIKTQATTQTTVIETDKNVMLPPIVEPTRMVGLTGPSIAPATATLPATAPFPTTARSAALPMGGFGRYPQQRFMHPQHYHGHPYYHHHQHMMGYMPPMQRGFGGPMGGGGGLDAEERMSLGVVAPLMPGEREILIGGVGNTSGGGLKEKLHLGHNHTASHHDGPVTPDAPGMTGVETTMHHKASVGQKLRGAVKEVQGAVTRNPAKKEEGKMLMHGVDPATAASTTGAGF